MKLQLIHDFELEVEEQTYTATFKDLTKKQIKAIDKLSPTAELKELKKLQRTKGDEDRIEELLEIIESFSTEDIYKKRLELSIEGDDKKAIMAIGEIYSYSRVFETIVEDISKRKSGN